MRLTGFKINNIKSIIDTGWCHVSDNDNITVFAGQNEAGKSALLEGLNFFRNGSTPAFERLSKRSDELHPYVECEFRLEKEDFDGDPDISGIIKKFAVVKLCRGDVTKDDYASIKFAPDTDKSIDEEIKKEIENERQRREMEKLVTTQTETSNSISTTVEVVPVPSAEPLIDDPNTYKTALLEYFIDYLPEFIYYDSFSSILPGTVKLSEISNFKAIDDFQKVFKINFKDIINKGVQARTSELLKVIRRASVDLNSYWKQKQTTEEDDHYSYEINLNPNLADLTQSTIEFLIHRNDGIPLFIEQKSKGFQWFSSFNLRLKALGIDITNAHKYLILIDEPGQGLHETAQADVKGVLEELGHKGMQIVYTTHNPCLIGVKDQEILRIRLVYQTREDGTKVKNIAQYSTTEGSQDALSPIINAMGINSIGQLLDRAVPCVALEGITDHYYFTAMKKILGIKENYSFIPAVGVGNIKPLVSVLIGWGTIFKAVFDDGEGKRLYADLFTNIYGKDEVETKKHIYKMEGFNGIEDLFSKKDFETHILKEKRDHTLSNSEYVKREHRKKELLARLFLEQVNTSTTPIILSTETKQNFQKVFSWLKG